MKNNRQRLLEYALLVIFIICANVFLSIFTTSTWGLIILWGISFAAVAYSRMNIFHPLSWFSVVFSLYYSAYALLVLVYNVKLAYGLTGESLQYSVIALSVVLIICGLPHNEKYYQTYGHTKKMRVGIDNNDYLILEKCLVFGIIVAFVLTIIVSMSFVSKSMSTKGSLFSICTYLIRALMYLCGAYILTSNQNNRAKKWVIIACGILCILFGFLNAERDCILRYFLVITITLFYKNIISIKHFIIIIPSGMIAMVVINMLKYFFIDNSIRYYSGGLFRSFLATDFGAPGGNLQNLVNHSLAGYAGYETIITDIVRGVIPMIKVGRNYNIWYNEYFFSGSSYSRAFTIVGEGYLIDGVTGIIILFILISLIIVILSKRAYRSVWSLMSYIYGIITMVSCFRGTLIDIFTGLVRTPLFGILLYLGFQCFYRKGKIYIQL